MKPSDQVSLYNWEATLAYSPEQNETIKKRMEAIWKKDYKTRH